MYDWWVGLQLVLGSFREMTWRNYLILFLVRKSKENGWSVGYQARRRSLPVRSRKMRLVPKQIPTSGEGVMVVLLVVDRE